MNNTISVGVSRADITPKVPLPLYGMGNDYVRKENFVFPTSEEDFLKADVLLLSDGEEKAVICTLDTLYIHSFLSDAVKESVSEALSIPKDNIILTASHSHSAVSICRPDEDVQEYNRDVVKAITDAVAEAEKDLGEAKVLSGSVNIDGMNFQRRFVMKDGSHKCIIADKTFSAEEIASYETAPDNGLGAVKFIREGKKDILIVNWQAHPGFTPSFTKGVVSADYIGSLRAACEKQGDTHFIYFQGAAGNMEARTRFTGDVYYAKSRAFTRESYARELLNTIDANLPFEPAKCEKIEVKTSCLTVRKKDGQKVLDETNSLILTTVTFGDIAICTVPAEVYSDTGLAIKGGSPYKTTLLCSNANGCFGYLPVKECFDGESYVQNERGDSFGVRVSKCECGTAERVADTLLSMLKKQ